MFELYRNQVTIYKSVRDLYEIRLKPEDYLLACETIESTFLAYPDRNQDKLNDLQAFRKFCIDVFEEYKNKV